jgi:hypothetical protein
MSNMNDMDRKLEQHFKTYRRHIQSLEKSSLNHIRGISDYDRWALGEQLAKVDSLFGFVKKKKGEAYNSSTSDLGTLPNVALDIVTVLYGESIVPLIASVQPVPDELSTVYFKQVTTRDKRGSMTEGEVIRDPRYRTDPMIGYANERVENITVTTTDGTHVTYTGVFSTPPVPIRPGTLSLWYKETENEAKAVDDGQGTLLGAGMQGTINYKNGAYSITFVGFVPAAGNPIMASAAQNFEAAKGVPMIDTGLDSMPIKAEIYTLGAEIGLLKEYALSQRFGRVGSEEMMQDLADEMTSEASQTVISRLIGSQLSDTNVNWNKTPAMAVSWFEHKQELSDKISDVSAIILMNAGRGQVNYLIAGAKAASNLSTLPGFEAYTVQDAIGPHVFGTFNGITLIRNPNQDQSIIYAAYRGSSPFEAPIVYAPYMPLIVTGELTYGTNPLLKQGLAALWVGVKPVIPAFLGSITITEVPRT